MDFNNEFIWKIINSKLILIEREIKSKTLGG